MSGPDDTPSPIPTGGSKIPSSGRCSRSRAVPTNTADPATKIVPFGAFVRVEDRSDGFEGLLHKSELAGIHVQAGDVLTVKIAQVDTMRRRIQLTRRP